MKQALSFGLLVLLLVIPLSATAAEAYGTLTLVQVRRAGFLEEDPRGRLATLGPSSGAEQQRQ